jgi:signal peptidase I
VSVRLEAPPSPPPASAPTPEPARQKAKVSSSAAHTLRELPVLFAIAVAIAFVVKTFLAQAFYIPSTSMTSQLQVNDRVVVSKLAYKLHDPHRGDIVVFDAPGDRFKPEEPDRGPVGRVVHFVLERIGVVQPSTNEFIKRVVGLPGETVEGKDGKVWVNGRALQEPYLEQGTITGGFGPVTVPQGTLLVMGDNRGNSFDSRFFGAVKQDTVVGRAFVKVWPFRSASFL